MLFNELVERYSGKCVVVGCGMSAPNILPYKDEVFTIGVNDTCTLLDLDMCVIIDKPIQFTMERLERMLSAKCRYLATPHARNFSWFRCGEFVDIKVGGHYNEHFDEHGRNNVIDCHGLSVHSAILIAYYMGFRDIGMIGNDFTDGHFYDKDKRRYSQFDKLNEINKFFKELEILLKRNGTELVNLSDISRIDVTKMEIDKWIEI